MFTILSTTAPLQIANVTNMKNNSSHTGSFKMNDNISNDYTYYCHQFKQVSYSSIFVYTAIKRRLLVEAGTETNPGPISNATISLTHHVTRDQDDRKFLNIYCQNGFVPFNLSIITDVSATLKDCLSSICTCDIFSSCCSCIILPEYEVETLSYIKTLSLEGSVDIHSPEARWKVLECLVDLKCDVDVLNTGCDHSSEIRTQSSVSMASTMNISVNSNTKITGASNYTQSSSTHLVPPFQVEQVYYCRFNCGFRSPTKNMLKKHYKRNICNDSKIQGESGSQCQQALDASDTQVSYSVSNYTNLSKSLDNQNLIESYGHDHLQQITPEAENRDEDQNSQGYRCVKCDKTFTKLKGLRDHTRNVHQLRKLCDMCPKSFSYSKNLDRHKKNIHIDRESEVQCNKCLKSLKNIEHLESHSKSCPKTQNKEHYCLECSRKYSSKSSLRQHTIGKHKIGSKQGNFMIMAKIIKKYKKISRKFICHMCQHKKKFSSNFNLKRHIQSVHDGYTDRVVTGTSVLYLSHEEQQKMIEQTEDCTLCEEKFICLDDLQNHKMTYHGTDRYQCLKCDKSFSKPHILRLHVRRVHSTITYECTLCCKVFKENYILQRHYKSHTNPPKPRNLKPLNSLSQSQLRKRMKIQAEEISNQINENTAEGRSLLLKEVIKKNPDLIKDRVKPFEEEDIIEIIKDANLSDRKMLIILQKIREKWGRESITPNIRDHLKRRKTVLDRFFTYRLLSNTKNEESNAFFKSKLGTPLRRFVVFCHDVPGLVAWKTLLEGEDVTEYMKVVGVDDGKSLLKICWNWSKKCKDEGKYKLMGPKRSIVLACVSDVPESSHNIRILFNLLGISEINFILSQDLKLHNITLGKQSHSSKHPCSYCNGFYNNKIQRWVKGDDLTLRNLSSDRKQWLRETNGDRSQLQKFNNVEHEAIVSFDEDSRILVKIPPPALHVCLLGPVNYIIQQLEKVYPSVSDEIERLHIVRERYQGKTFEGVYHFIQSQY